MQALPKRLAVSIAVVLAGQAAPAQAPAEAAIRIGAKPGIVDSLRDLRGNRRALSDFEGKQALVVFFAATKCPLANLYVPRLIELEASYRSKDVKFVAVYSNRSDTVADVAEHSSDRDVPFLVLKDFDQQLADRLGIERTAAVAVLDGDLTLRYRGRIDDQYAVASKQAAPKRRELVAAIDALLSGDEIETPETVVDGCLFDRARIDPELEDVTFTKDVAPIIQRRCQECHRPGQIGPFSLETYRDAMQWKGMIHEVVVQRRMPPWQADRRYGEFSNDRGMPPEEVAILRSWIEGGAKRGNPKDLPPPREWDDSWNIGTPDVVLESPREIPVRADGVMDYIYLRGKTGFDGDVWVEQAQVLPGDASVLHHVLVYITTPGGPRIYMPDGSTTALVGWAPGEQPMRNPPGTATKIPAGSELVWELHYTPNGTATVDRTRLGLVLADGPPERETKLNIFANRRIRIAARSPHHAEEDSFEFDEDSKLLSLMPHMHVRGKAYRYVARYPDGRTETLLSVPRWDFNWQTSYVFAEPPLMPKGTVIEATAHWDNSDDNLLNPDPDATVRYGLQTFEEMMNGWVKYTPVKAGRGEPR